MFIMNSKKLLFIFSLVISFPLLFGSGCVHQGKGEADICCVCVGPLAAIKDLNSGSYIKQIEGFSLCDDQKTYCWDGKAEAGLGLFTVMVPYGTNVKKLAAYFKYQGADVYIGKTKQISGKTVNDFTYPVVYRVQAKNGSSRDCYVRVIAAPEKTICEFFLTVSFARWYGIIDQSAKTISVMLPSGIAGEHRRSREKLKANVIYSGRSLSGPEENDFTSPVVYTVKAKDGSSVNYTVTVTVVPQNTLYEFMIDTYCIGRHWYDACNSARPPDTAYRGHIDRENKSITVNLPDRDGIDVKNLYARFHSSGYQQFVGRYSETGSFDCYKRQEKPYDCKVVDPQYGFRANDFTFPVIFRLQDRDGSSVDYTVKVTIVPEKTISEFFLSACLDYCEKYYGVVEEKTKTISVVLPDDKKGKALSSLKANLTYSGSSVFIDQTKQISGITENDFSSPVVYRVTARDGSSADYTVTVTFQPGAR